MAGGPRSSRLPAMEQSLNRPDDVSAFPEPRSTEVFGALSGRLPTVSGNAREVVSSPATDARGLELGWTLGLTLPLALALGWEVAWRLGLASGRLMPPPSRIVETLA